MQAGVTNRLDVDRKMLDCARDRPRSSTLPLPLLLLLGLPIPHPHCDADATVVADIIDVCGCMASGCLWPHQVPRGQKGCTVPCHPHYAHRSLHGSPPLAVADLFNLARVVDAMADGVVLGDGGAAGWSLTFSRTDIPTDLLTPYCTSSRSSRRCRSSRMKKSRRDKTAD